MKLSILITTLTITTALLANQSMNMINLKIKNIDKKRNGLDNKIFAKLKDPFYLPRIEVNKTKEVISAFVKKEGADNLFKTVKNIFTEEENIQKELAPLSIEATLNKSVLINKRWYHIGDDVEGYKILNIFSNYIIVDQYGEKIKLKLQTKNPNIKFKKQKKRVK